MPKPVEEQIYILVSDRGYLAPLKMTGPVVRPIKVPKSIAAKLVMNGCTVYEYDIESKMTVKLTFENINDSSRLDEIRATIPAEEPVKVETPAPENVVVVESEPDPIEIPKEAENAPAVEPAPNVFDRLKPEDYVFDYNEDGTVDETNINWSKFSDKEERRAIRARIKAINQAAREKLEAVSEE